MRRRCTMAAATLVAAALLVPQAAPADSGAGRFWRSMAIPGWGQHAAGHGSAARRFLAVEAALWLGYGGLKQVADIRARTFRTHAATHAGARPAGKDRQYFDDLGFYASHQQHNLFAAVEEGAAAQLYPGTSEFSWEWDADASRERYRRLRNDAQSMDRNALYVTGLVVVNHLVAAVHAARLDAGAEAGGGGGADGSPAVPWSIHLWPDGAFVGLRHRF